MDLGEHYPCLNVKNLQQSIEFYQKLDFKIIEDHQSENWAVLQHNNMALCLYQGHIETNCINFRGGDIDAIYKEATARGLKFEKPALIHPDGSHGTPRFTTPTATASSSTHSLMRGTNTSAPGS